MNLRYVLISVFILCMTTSFVVYAADVGFKCVECHEQAIDILPAKHADINDFTKCFSCHFDGGKAPKLGQKVHEKHLADMGTSEETCLSCHNLDDDNLITINVKKELTMDREDLADTAKKFTSFYENGKLANSHKNAGKYCLSCHTAFDIDETDAISSKCILCHGKYEDMAKVTENSGFMRNPHKSHFPTLACNKCHQTHEDFTDYCIKCHQWGFKWEQSIK